MTSWFALFSSLGAAKAEITLDTDDSLEMWTMLYVQGSSFATVRIPLQDYLTSAGGLLCMSWGR